MTQAQTLAAVLVTVRTTGWSPTGYMARNLVSCLFGMAGRPSIPVKIFSCGIDKTSLPIDMLIPEDEFWSKFP